MQRNWSPINAPHFRNEYFVWNYGYDGMMANVSIMAIVLFNGQSNTHCKSKIDIKLHLINPTAFDLMVYNANTPIKDYHVSLTH